MDKQLSGFKYYVYDNPKNEKERFKIITPDNRPIPPYLYKYYSLESYNIDAVINNYFYASHPRELNDPFDSFQYLLDYDNLNLADYKKILIAIMPEETIDYLYANNRKALLYEYSKYFHAILYAGMGIVSMTTHGENRNMWNYYSKYNGFTISVNTSLLPDSFCGPFPLNYKDKFEKLSISQVDPRLCILYQTNVKSKKWVDEDEWRYLIPSNQLLKIPGVDMPNSRNRKFNYDKNAIVEITLGFYFIDESEISLSSNDELLVRLKNKKKKMKERRKLLSYIANNPVKAFWIRISTANEFKIDRKEIELKKLSSNRFIIKYVG